jgi:hypothetical protein
MVNRITPKLAVTQVKSYDISSPKGTHYRTARCDEVDCKAQARGWETFVDESTSLGQRQAHYIRKQSGRAFRESRNEFGITVFAFPSGQSCFKVHEVRLDRPEFFIARDGDWRGNPTGRRRLHDQPEHWVEDFASHQEGLIRATR